MGGQCCDFPAVAMSLGAAQGPVSVGKADPEQREGEGNRVSEREEGTAGGLDDDGEGQTPVVGRCLVVVGWFREREAETAGRGWVGGHGLLSSSAPSRRPSISIFFGFVLSCLSLGTFLIPLLSN